TQPSPFAAASSDSTSQPYSIVKTSLQAQNRFTGGIQKSKIISRHQSVSYSSSPIPSAQSSLPPTTSATIFFTSAQPEIQQQKSKPSRLQSLLDTLSSLHEALCNFSSDQSLSFVKNGEIMNTLAEEAYMKVRDGIDADFFNAVKSSVPTDLTTSTYTNARVIALFHPPLLSRAIVDSIFVYIVFFIATSLCNSLLNPPYLYSVTTGFQLNVFISELATWLRKNCTTLACVQKGGSGIEDSGGSSSGVGSSGKLDPFGMTSYHSRAPSTISDLLSPLQQLATVLMCEPSYFLGQEARKDMCPSLSLRALLMIISKKQPCSMSAIVPKEELIQQFVDLKIAEEKANEAEQKRAFDAMQAALAAAEVLEAEAREQEAEEEGDDGEQQKEEDGEEQDDEKGNGSDEANWDDVLCAATPSDSIIIHMRRSKALLKDQVQNQNEQGNDLNKASNKKQKKKKKKTDLITWDEAA
ncbi:MAG: hypothetical protein EZS28_045322, partial [Streblomastix strix]